ncbi:hypothetical protein H696_05824 [Fonticula alba]|uniref:Uncharacterized protein n=1 Tax=Fonticula alba TaxID=691883 RepID=A0A058Z0P7_FONAL|nr:hypothetical protein H696_05824 [Fonticula alba]KCV67716.1 hypothetical protein H696_05824 [Fonticula alba]|eukprot:XP_009497900.1 hypothetical protein H696_05824 [Fonticula alba]
MCGAVDPGSGTNKFTFSKSQKRVIRRVRRAVELLQEQTPGCPHTGPGALSAGAAASPPSRRPSVVELFDAAAGGMPGGVAKPGMPGAPGIATGPLGGAGASTGAGDSMSVADWPLQVTTRPAAFRQEAFELYVRHRARLQGTHFFSSLDVGSAGGGAEAGGRRSGAPGPGGFPVPGSPACPAAGPGAGAAVSPAELARLAAQPLGELGVDLHEAEQAFRQLYVDSPLLLERADGGPTAAAPGPAGAGADTPSGPGPGPGPGLDPEVVFANRSLDTFPAMVYGTFHDEYRTPCGRLVALALVDRLPHMVSRTRPVIFDPYVLLAAAGPGCVRGPCGAAGSRRPGGGGGPPLPPAPTLADIAQVGKLSIGVYTTLELMWRTKHFCGLLMQRYHAGMAGGAAPSSAPSGSSPAGAAAGDGSRAGRAGARPGRRVRRPAGAGAGAGAAPRRPPVLADAIQSLAHGSAGAGAGAASAAGPPVQRYVHFGYYYYASSSPASHLALPAFSGGAGPGGLGGGGGGGAGRGAGPGAPRQSARFTASYLGSGALAGAAAMAQSANAPTGLEILDSQAFVWLPLDLCRPLLARHARRATFVSEETALVFREDEISDRDLDDVPIDSADPAGCLLAKDHGVFGPGRHSRHERGRYASLFAGSVPRRMIVRFT